VILHHVSSLDPQFRDYLFDKALTFIWNYTHCLAIRLNLYHLKDESGNLKADKDIKALLKAKKFKWKTVQNDVATGHRCEILEALRFEEVD